MFFLDTNPIEQNIAYLLLFLTIVPIAMLMIYSIIASLRKRHRLQGELQEQIRESEDLSQINLFQDVYGGKNNIVSVDRQLNRITVVVKDIEKVKADELPQLGANGVLLVDNSVKCSFGDRAPYIYEILNKGAV